MVLWTAFGSVFALLLGYSRVPYAAARDGYFFAPFARLHPTAGFPTVSVVVLGLIAIAASMFSLALVIDALIVTRILVQFIGQIAGVMRLRRVKPEMPRPYRIWLYPLPAFVALAGWLFIFLTTNVQVIGFGLGLLVARSRSLRVCWSTHRCDESNDGRRCESIYQEGQGIQETACGSYRNTPDLLFLMFDALRRATLPVEESASTAWVCATSR